MRIIKHVQCEHIRPARIIPYRERFIITLQSKLNVDNSENSYRVCDACNRYLPVTELKEDTRYYPGRRYRRFVCKKQCVRYASDNTLIKLHKYTEETLKSIEWRKPERGVLRYCIICNTRRYTISLNKKENGDFECIDTVKCAHMRVHNKKIEKIRSIDSMLLGWKPNGGYFCKDKDLYGNLKID